MECVVSLFFLMVFLTVMVGIASSRHGRASQWNQTYQRIARQFHGATSKSGWFGQPTAWFFYNDTQVIVGTSRGGLGNRQLTQVQLDWPDSKCRLEIFSARYQRIISRLCRGLHPYEPIPQSVPRGMCVFCLDQREARELLNDGVCWQLNQLHSRASGHWFRIGIYKGCLTLQVAAVLRRFEDLQPLLVAFLELYDQAMLTRSEGIEFLADDQLKPLDDAKCQVCGDLIKTDLVFCRQCKTPHHLECWHYVGVCTIYGCGETVYVLPRSAEIIRGPSAHPKSRGFRPGDRGASSSRRAE